MIDIPDIYRKNAIVVYDYKQECFLSEIEGIWKETDFDGKVKNRDRFFVTAFIGETDKDGRRIFNGDLLRVTFKDGSSLVFHVYGNSLQSPSNPEDNSPYTFENKKPNKIAMVPREHREIMQNFMPINDYIEFKTEFEEELDKALKEHRCHKKKFSAEKGKYFKFLQGEYFFKIRKDSTEQNFLHLPLSRCQDFSFFLILHFRDTDYSLHFHDLIKDIRKVVFN